MGTIEGTVNINESKHGNILVISLRGRLDAIATPGAEKKIFDHINNGQHLLILDFSGIDYLSSAGMRMLLSITKKLKTLSGKLVLCSIKPDVLDVLKMSGFDQVLEFCANDEEALKLFQTF